jgi:hypothetical protein
MTEKSHIVSKYEASSLAAGFCLLVEKGKVQDYKKQFENPHFLSSDVRPLAKGLIVALHAVTKDISKIPSFPTIDQAVKNFSLETPNKDYEFFKNAINNDTELLQKRKDDGYIDVFIQYMQLMVIANNSKFLASKYGVGDYESCLNILEQTASEMTRLKAAEFQRFDIRNYYDVMDKEWKDRQMGIIKTTLFLSSQTTQGGREFDEAIGGGLERQTLNVFIAATGGGKSVMAHHILVRCIKQKIHAHITVVEDREKSFFSKLMSALTGIEASRIKQHFGSLTIEERGKIKQAIADVETYITIDFCYSYGIDQIHQIKLEADEEKRRLGLPVPAVDIVDYTGHIAKYSKGDKKHEQMHLAYSARKDFALKYDKICVDFAQVNREGGKRHRDSETLGITDLAGSYDLSQVCDLIISINRSEKDKADNQAVLSLEKTRDGVGRKFIVKTNFASMQYLTDQVMDYKAFTVNKQSISIR